ncbi:myb-like protein A-like [Hibiscus syriacus]|uniref:Myb-like protein A-like n=1 Tax=Hibiscus syriacus TaxID=106335 RepID=A0A6A2YLM4_HIBSY|nr:mitogen-activated protein kinase kinase kinase 18-like [Hibiscus syriacus]KAE8680229.1 myb-like protein A-like [Hibiscus syriacus]
MEWIRGPAIGRGSTATVSLATVISSGELFAVKSTELCRSKLLQRENYLLSKLSCPHIVKYIGHGVTNEVNDEPTYNLCMEYVAGGTLSDEIQRVGGRLGEEKVRFYTQQIMQGLSYLHVNGVAHCDIKSQNILIGKEGAKIADLGCAKLMRKDCFDTTMISGTPAFMAPEVARGEEQGFEADIWALGCTIIEMISGNSPWPELKDPVSALYKIGFSGEVPEIPRWLSEEGKDFLGKCLKRDLKERWTAKELLQHPFLEESETLLMEVMESTMDSPNSVLDQGFWDSLNVMECPKNPISMNSPADRIKKLLQSTLPPPSNWTLSEEDWITVRSSGIEQHSEFQFTTVSSIDSFEEQIETESSIFDEDFFLDSSAENTIDFTTIFVFDSVTDDKFVSDDLNFEKVNEISCSIPMLISPKFPIVLEIRQRPPASSMPPAPVTNLCEQRRLKG